ncbi:MAG: ZIP family metal transporter, partial [Verrucomicrobia bacterium]|nr:ZIP family metal transporter [Prolixibacteraceae bacterium]
MVELLKITAIGLVSGMLGTSIGGLAAFFVRNVKNRTLSFILEFSAGLMTAVVCFELIPEAFRLGGQSLSMIGLGIGVCSLILIEDFVKKVESMRTSPRSGLLRAGVLMAIGIALHNFPEGFAVGAGFQSSITLGVTLTAVIMIHDIPEGMAIAVPLKAAGVRPIKAFIVTALSGIPMGIGAFCGALLGEVSPLFISICLGFAGGAMLYVVYAELVPESKRLYYGRFSS